MRLPTTQLPKTPDYEALLDAVLYEEGLTEMANEVIAAVAFSPEEWEALIEEERRRVLERRPLVPSPSERGRLRCFLVAARARCWASRHQAERVT